MVVVTRSKKKLGISGCSSIERPRAKIMRKLFRLLHNEQKEQIINQGFASIVMLPCTKCGIHVSNRVISLTKADRQRMRHLRLLLQVLQEVHEEYVADENFDKVVFTIKCLAVTFFRYFAVAKGEANPIGSNGSLFEVESIVACGFGEEADFFFISFLGELELRLHRLLLEEEDNDEENVPVYPNDENFDN